MPRFHISQQIPVRNIAADGVYQFDLGVMPLSVIRLNLQPLNDTGTLANWNNAIRIATAMNRVSVLHKGRAIHSARGEDLVAFNFLRWGMLPLIKGSNSANTDNDRRQVTVDIVMGRLPYHPTSVFPACGKGELTLEIDFDIADTGYDGLNFSVDTIELPDAKPKEYERRVSQSATFNATGYQDLDLPVGNIVRGIMLYGTTGYTGAAPAPSWGAVSVLLDNQEYGFRDVNWESLTSLQALWGRPGLNAAEDDHGHNTTVDGNAGTAVTTLAGGGHDQSATPATYSKYAFLDFDPTLDDMYVLDASKSSRLQLRANAETADAVRAMTVEALASSVGF